jgi:hypothetical protein
MSEAGIGVNPGVGAKKCPEGVCVRTSRALPERSMRSSPQHQHGDAHDDRGGGEDHLRVPGDAAKDRADLIAEGIAGGLQVLRERVEHGRPDRGGYPQVFLPVGDAERRAFARQRGEGGEEQQDQEDAGDPRARLLLVNIIADLPRELPHRRDLISPSELWQSGFPPGRPGRRRRPGR